MTSRQEMIEKVRRAAVRANPSMLDLTLGCEIRNIKNNTHYYITDSNIVGSVHIGDFKAINTVTLEGYHGMHSADTIEIIGRKIGLADVLLAIGNSLLLQVDTEGFFYTWEKEDAEQGKGYCQSGVNWNLLTDDLTQQSDELLTFLCELLPEE